MIAEIYNLELLSTHNTILITKTLDHNHSKPITVRNPSSHKRFRKLLGFAAMINNSFEVTSSKWLTQKRGSWTCSPKTDTKGKTFRPIWRIHMDKNIRRTITRLKGGIQILWGRKYLSCLKKTRNFGVTFTTREKMMDKQSTCNNRSPFWKRSFRTTKTK